MKVLLCIDDTDNLESPGTGELAENLSNIIMKKELGECSRVSRHQLFFNDAIPYTSHNSSMCFEIKTYKKNVNNIITLAVKFLEINSAKGSDPGLCVAVVDNITDNNRLIEFGKKTKNQVIKKEEALMLAKELKVHLSEHGGDGMGVIGALAGVGLRLYGDDGRYKGKFKIGVNQDNMLVKDLLSHPFIDKVLTEDGQELNENIEVFITDKIKTVRLNSLSVLLVKEHKCENGIIVWQNCDKKELKKY